MPRKRRPSVETSNPSVLALRAAAAKLREPSVVGSSELMLLGAQACDKWADEIEASRIISHEELTRIRRLAKDFYEPPSPRAGYQTVEMYEELEGFVMKNLNGLLEAAARGVT